MPRVVSVEKSLMADGSTQHFVTLENDDKSRTRIQVGEKEAEGFKRSLKESKGSGPRLLTETFPF